MVAMENRDVVVNQPVTFGQIIDFIRENKALQAQRDRTFTFRTTVGSVMSVIGEEKMKDLLQNRSFL